MDDPRTPRRSTRTPGHDAPAARTTTSAQPSASTDPALVRRAADLCRWRPALFAAVVRHADALERAGVDRREALDRALTAAGC